MLHPKILVDILSDGHFHSGQVLGARLGVSRARIWQNIKVLSSYGLVVESVPGRGYRLATPLSLLDAHLISNHLSAESKSALAEIEIAFSLESTNTHLMNKARDGTPSGSVCLAEHQRAGRGRRERSWISPFGRNIYLSLLWRFLEGPARLGGLSLIVAMAVVDALKSLGVTGLSVKWPNDIYSSEGKVGGVLMEVAGEHNGPSHVVIGIGLNVDMPPAAGDLIEQAWGNIPVCNTTITRNVIAAALLNHLVDFLGRFQADGPAQFLSNWKSYDLIDGTTVDLHLHDKVISGVARGVDERGFLVIERGDGVDYYSSGEITLRLRTAR